MTDRNEMDLLLQNEWRQKVIPNLDAKQWIRVYQRFEFEGAEHLSMYSGLIPNENVQAVLASPGWGIHIGESTPSYTKILDEETNRHILKYDRFSFKHGIEPLIIRRYFHGLKPEIIEISEEFQLFHNLYFESSDSTYVKFDDAGDPYDVVKLFDNYVEVRRKEIRQFLAVRDMSLGVYFDRRYFSHQNIAMIDENNRVSDVQESSYTYRFFAAENRGRSRRDDKYLSCSRLYGKRIIKGFPPEKIGDWLFHNEDKKEFEKFIIAVDEDDEPISFSPEPYSYDAASSDNEASPDYAVPDYRTLVFFRRKVLAKYYNEPSKYRVEDGLIRCGNQWLLRIDNNHPDYVIVLFGDLVDLPHTEQKHWQSYNVPPPPDGQMSATNFKRSFLAEFADPEDSALRFKDAYSILSRSWHKKFGWDLFKPLSSDDSHHLITLRRPLTTELSELDGIAVSISKLLIEGINVDKIQQIIKSSRENKDKSIPYLKEYLTLYKYDDSKDYIKYLKEVQELRSVSAAHRKDNWPERYQKAAEFFSIDSRNPIHVADDIFTTLADFLDSIRTHFCLDETD